MVIKWQDLGNSLRAIHMLSPPLDCKFFFYKKIQSLKDIGGWYGTGDRNERDYPDARTFK
jgi:hypothetical protein